MLSAPNPTLTAWVSLILSLSNASHTLKTQIICFLILAIQILGKEHVLCSEVAIHVKDKLEKYRYKPDMDKQWTF